MQKGVGSRLFAPTSQVRRRECVTRVYPHLVLSMQPARDQKGPRGAKSHRPLQFRLRTALLLITLLALPLAWYATGLRQRRAVAEIRRLGGSVLYDYQCELDVPNPQPRGPAWLRKIVGDEYFVRVVDVDLDDTKVTDAGLERLRAFRHLRELSLRRTRITDRGLHTLAQFDHLRGLQLTGTAVTDKGVEELSRLANLQWLCLGDTAVTDRALPHLSKLRNLEGLELSRTDLTDAAWRHLRALKNLRWLSLRGTRVTAAGLDELAALPNLRVVHLENTEVDDGSLGLFTPTTMGGLQVWCWQVDAAHSGAGGRFRFNRPSASALFLARTSARVPPQVRDAVAAWIDAADVWDYEAEQSALRRMKATDGGAPAVPLLVELLDIKNDELRSCIVRALGEIGPEARPTVPKLMELLRENPFYLGFAQDVLDALRKLQVPEALTGAQNALVLPTWNPTNNWYDRWFRRWDAQLGATKARVIAELGRPMGVSYEGSQENLALSEQRFYKRPLRERSSRLHFSKRRTVRPA